MFGESLEEWPLILGTAVTGARSIAAKSSGPPEPDLQQVLEGRDIGEAPSDYRPEHVRCQRFFTGISVNRIYS